LAKDKKSRVDDELFELLKPTRAIQLKVQKIFDELPEKFAVLVVEKQKEYPAVNVELIKYFLKKGVPGVYVSINKTAEDLTETFEKEKIDTSKIIFLDAVSRMSDGKKIEKENYLYVESPKDLVELSVSLEEAVGKLKGKKFIVFDSITTLLIYNKAIAIEKFVHAIAGKMHAWEAKGVFTAMDSTEKGQISTLAQFFDQVIKF